MNLSSCCTISFLKVLSYVFFIELELIEIFCSLPYSVRQMALQCLASLTNMQGSQTLQSHWTKWPKDQCWKNGTFVFAVIHMELLNEQSTAWMTALTQLMNLCMGFVQRFLQKKPAEYLELIVTSRRLWRKVSCKKDKQEKNSDRLPQKIVASSINVSKNFFHIRKKL